MPLARLAPPKMGLSGLLPILVPFILLGGVQEPELVQGFFRSKYWGLSLSSRDTESGREEGTKNSRAEERFPPPQPGILGGRVEMFEVILPAPFLLVRCPR